MENQRTVLLIEDNPDLNSINRRALEMDGYAVLTAMELAQARICLTHCDPDVILLDVMMPDGNGMDFCAEIRKTTTAHILFLTSSGEDNERLKGFEVGADDYITKPYKLEELLSRVRASMRRRQMQQHPFSSSMLTRGILTLNPLTGQAFLKGQDMCLAQKEFAVLWVLAEIEGKAFTKNELYEKVWNQPLKEDDRPIKSMIYRLRKKLKNGNSRMQISNTRGEGYRLEF